MFLLLRLSCCVARNAKFIRLGKQWGNKCLIVVTRIHLRRGHLQLSAFSCGTQTHLTLGREGQKNRGSPGNQGSPKIPIPIPLHLRTCFLMHSFLHSELLLLTLQRHLASENHTHSGWYLNICIPPGCLFSKGPWRKYCPPKAEKGIEHLLQRFHPLL